jgi:hypothetical protein
MQTETGSVGCGPCEEGRVFAHLAARPAYRYSVCNRSIGSGSIARRLRRGTRDASLR